MSHIYDAPTLRRSRSCGRGGARTMFTQLPDSTQLASATEWLRAMGRERERERERESSIREDDARPY
jgi:hypothetical protein